MNIQALVDAMGNAARQTRSQYQMTLGRMIERLEQLPADAPVVFRGQKCGPTEADSYRGYYADLAFASDGSETTVGKFLELCRSSLNREFTGYKGGEFVMGEDTPLWVAPYGSSTGIAIMDLTFDFDRVEIDTKQID